jgi:hypothetical protein
VIWDRILSLFQAAQPTSTGPRPCPQPEALARMLSLVGARFPYALGTGDSTGATTRDGLNGFDCWGAAFNYAYGVPRHRPGFNRGPWATVSDDTNCNSGIEDAEHKQDLFVPVEESDERPGDLLAYPTIRLRRIPPIAPFIGHVQMIVEVPAGWRRSMGFSLLKVVHCHGPNGRVPGVTLGRGDACDRHDERWSRPEHRTRVIRPKP